ncbi:hypothetical protein MHYP_G00028110 [Metynnis hypsauchen]
MDLQSVTTSFHVVMMKPADAQCTVEHTVPEPVRGSPGLGCAVRLRVAWLFIGEAAGAGKAEHAAPVPVDRFLRVRVAHKEPPHQHLTKQRMSEIRRRPKGVVLLLLSKGVAPDLMLWAVRSSLASVAAGIDIFEEKPIILVVMAVIVVMINRNQRLCDGNRRCRGQWASLIWIPYISLARLRQDFFSIWGN